RRCDDSALAVLQGAAPAVGGEGLRRQARCDTGRGRRTARDLRGAIRMKLRVSLIQQPIVWQDPEANRAHFASAIEPLASRTDLVVLPETFTTGFTMEVERVAEPVGGPTTEWLLGMARRLDAVVTGSVITV